MNKSSKKSIITTQEIYQLSHFKLQANADLSRLQKVWVLVPYEILRGEIYEIRKAFPARAYIRLENGKVVYIRTDKNERRNWIKERS